MDVRPCRSCKQLFNYLSGPPICPSCQDKLEKKFKVVREYVRENPHATMQEIANAGEVSVKQLKNWVREERLKFSDDSPIGLDCMNCGKTIKFGKYCESCKGKMANALSGMAEHEPAEPVAPPPKSSSHNRMRFLEN